MVYKDTDYGNQIEPRLLFLTLDDFPDPVFGVNLQRKVVLWNKAMERLTGISRDMVLGKGEYVYALPFFGCRRPCLIDSFFTVDRNTGTFSYELYRQEGRIILAESYLPTLNAYLEARAYPLLDAEGKLIGAVETIRDITVRKQAERELRMHRDRLNELVNERTVELERLNRELQSEIAKRKRKANALRASEELFRAAFEYAGIGMALTDMDGVFLQVNNSLCRILGRFREELLGRSFREISYEEDVDVDLTFMNEMLSGQSSTCQYEKRYLHKRGDIIWVLLNISLVRDVQNNPLYFIVQVQDITQRKQSDEQIKEYQKQLKSLASELSLTEAHERRQIANELHDNIGQVLALARLKLIELQKTIAPEGATSSDDVLRLLDQCLAYTRTLTFELSPPVLYDYGLEAAIQSLGRRFEAGYGVRFRYEDDGLPKPLNIEKRVLLFKAVRELLVNVVKHADADNVLVTICRHGNYIRISVEDDGVGYDTHSVSGGFGLFNIRERLEHIGGWIDVRSRSDEGTRVTISAPLDMESTASPKSR